MSNFMKILLLEAELFHVGGTDRHDEANGRFSQLSESASNQQKSKTKRKEEDTIKLI